MIICYNKTWVKQDTFNCFQAEGNTHNNTEVLLADFFQQFIERSHEAENISKRLHKKPLSPHSPSFDQHVSKCYSNSIVEGALLWNSTIKFSTWGGGGVQLGHCLYSVLNFFCELVMGENICNQSTVSCFNCCQFASRKQHFIGLKKKKNSRCNFTN